MKKFLSILLAGFIGFLGIFTTTSTAKNSAEPQYFFENNRKNAVVESNTLDFYFDPNINNFTSSDIELDICNFNIDSKLYYFDSELNRIEYDLYFESEDSNINLSNSYLKFKFTESIKEISFLLKSKENTGTLNLIYKIESRINEGWIINIGSTGEIIKNIYGFSILNYNLQETISDINTYLVPYIGDLTSLDFNTNQNTTIEQIGNIISDTTNWFVNIFIGLSDIFYSNGTLGVWGSILFLSVTFTIITMCLKWVISLIRGI